MVEADEALEIHHGERLLLELTDVEALEFRPVVTALFGFFRFDAEKLARRELSRRPDALGPRGSAPIGVSTDADGALRLRFLRPQEARGLSLTFRCRPDDRFWGFGEQYDGIDMRGRRLDAWTMEQGVGRAAGSPVPPIGRLTDSYFPMPWIFDPGRAYAP